MTLFRNPLAATQVILIALVPLTFVAFAYSIFAQTPGNRWVNDISGAVALLGAALALCRIWSEETSQRAGLFWLVASIGFSFLAISQWYEDRLEMVEHTLRIEDADDVLLLLLMPPIVLIGVYANGVSRVVKAILLAGFVVQAASAAMDLLDDWGAPPLFGSTAAAETATNYSELIFVELYVIAFSLFAAADLADRRESDDSVPEDRRPGHADTP